MQRQNGKSTGFCLSKSVWLEAGASFDTEVVSLVLYGVHASTCQPQYMTKTVWTGKVTLFALYAADSDD